MDYQQINEILEQFDADMDASEAHGVATGMLCVEPRGAAGNWLTELFGNSIDNDDLEPLTALFEATRQLLTDASHSFAFDLLLPDDDETLNVQAEAMRDWCQGFLFGVGYSQGQSAWPGDSGEVMRDLVEVTKMDCDNIGDEDADDLMEIHEYLRAAVYTVRDQFAERIDTQRH